MLLRALSPAAGELSRTHRVDGASDNTAQRVPGVLIEPVPEVVEALAGQEARDAIVEVWIKLVDHAFIFDHREKSDAKSQHAYAQQGEAIDDLSSC